MVWKWPGGGVDMVWRCHGGVMEVSLRSHGTVVEAFFENILFLKQFVQVAKNLRKPLVFH